MYAVRVVHGGGEGLEEGNGNWMKSRKWEYRIGVVEYSVCDGVGY